MFRALALIKNPMRGWDRIAQDERPAWLVFMAYFLPLILISGAAEGGSTAEWRTLDAGNYGAIRFNIMEIAIFEMLRIAMMLVIVAVGAYIVWLLNEQFHGGCNYQQALKLLMYSLSPLVLFHALNGIPSINLWISWGVGVYFSLKIFYYGMRCLSRSDPGGTEILFVLSSVMIICLTGAQQYMLIQCFTGHGASINSMIVDVASKLRF